jgi:hypothetical protein
MMVSLNCREKSVRTFKINLEWIDYVNPYINIVDAIHIVEFFINKLILKNIRIVSVIIMTQLSFAQRIDSTLHAQLEAKGEWKSYYLLNENVDYEFVPEHAEIDSIYFLEDGSMKQKVLKRLFHPLMGLSNQNRSLAQFQTIQSAYPYINGGSKISFAQYDQKQVAAVVELHPQFKSQIGGILGVSKGKDGKWLTTGEVDLHLENPRKEGTIMDLNWRQPNDRSRFLNIAYEMPFPFGLPFGTDIEFKQDFLEDQYIIESTSGAATGIGPLGQWKIGGKKESSKDLTDETEFKSESVILGLRGDRRNNRWMPSKGCFWEGEIVLGRFEDKVGETTVAEIQIRLDKYRELGPGVLFLSVEGQGVKVKGRDIAFAKKVKFGGANSVRGYAENYFSADWVVIHKVEWLFGDLDRSQLFFFLDKPVTGLDVYHDSVHSDVQEPIEPMLLHESFTRFKSGYGVGFRQYNGTLTLDISIGFSEGSSGSKLHLKFSSDL